MNTKILIYGAYGYTGRLITQEANRQSVTVHLAGRNEVPLRKLANEYNFDYTVINLKEEELTLLLKDFEVVIHCAGPFSETAIPMVNACIKSKTNYVDITGEISVFEAIIKKSEEASKAGVSLIPGVGFDVVPTDCLATHLHQLMPDATHLKMAFVGSKTGMSRGTAVTMVKNIAQGGYIRENSQLKNVPLAYKIQEVEFPHRKQLCMTIPWGDLMTAYHQTGIPNIVIYSGVGRKTLQKIKRFKSLKFLLGISWIQKIVRRKIENSINGPTEKALNEGKTYIVGTVSNMKKQQRKSTLITPEAYKLTALTALKSALKLLDTENNISKGYLTPAQAFGKDYILEFENVSRNDQV